MLVRVHGLVASICNVNLFGGSVSFIIKYAAIVEKRIFDGRSDMLLELNK